MNLNRELWLVWRRLRRSWVDYFRKAGLNLRWATEKTLFRLLLNPIEVDFGLFGLEEFSHGGCRGIEPGDPALSLFYHVLASPRVIRPELNIEDYPTLDEIDIVENCVFAAARPSIADLRSRARGTPLAIVVFAYEYAPAIDTVHQRHADLCFSRTGISRIGNASPHYVRSSRGFLPNSGLANSIHVVPTRYGAFISALTKGNKQTIGPERFQDGDQERDFWVPIHKLFNGPDCIDGIDVNLSFSQRHLNEKIRGVHLALQNEGVPTGWDAADLTRYPFRISENLAKFDANHNLLKPIPHPLVEPAKTKDGKYVGFPVPAHHDRDNATLWFKNLLGARRWPEFVHVKHALEDEKIVYLPDRKDSSIIDIVEAGGYTALNFVDHTADGWVDVTCPSLELYIPERLSAYSILAQPDFLPLVKQKDLAEWWENSSPPEIRGNIWPDSNISPSPLSDSRLPADITLTHAHFDSTDTTITAVIGLDRVSEACSHVGHTPVRRESTLSYRATNLFGPGWDTSEDFNRDVKSPNGTFHLATYGLGSPYPEDTMICAATGALWPGAVPDVTRLFSPHLYPSVTPILDSDIGWDGLPQPQVTQSGTILYKVFAYADYVKSIADASIAYEHFAEMTLEDYISRTLAVARVYEALGAESAEDRAQYAIVSFRHATPDDLTNLLQSSGVQLQQKTAYRLLLAPTSVPGIPVPNRFDLLQVTPDAFEEILADTTTVARWRSSARDWQIWEF